MPAIAKAIAKRPEYTPQANILWSVRQPVVSTNVKRMMANDNRKFFMNIFLKTECKNSN